MNTSVLITGASGYLGSHLAARLHLEGCHVHALVRPRSDLGLLRARCPAALIHAHDGSTQSMHDIVTRANPDCVYHLASLFIAEHRPDDVAPLIRSNVEFGTQLLEAMAAAGVRKFVNAATATQHFGGRAYCPATLYAASKQAFQAIAQYYVDAHSLLMATLTLFDTYGPADPRRKIITLLNRIALSNEPLEMSPGNQMLDLVYVDDVVEAFICAGRQLETPAADSRDIPPEYAISSGRPRTLREVVEVAQTVLRRKLPITFGARPYRKRESMELWSAGRALPGWTAKIDLRQGLERTFAAVAKGDVA